MGNRDSLIFYSFLFVLPPAGHCCGGVSSAEVPATQRSLRSESHLCPWHRHFFPCAVSHEGSYSGQSHPERSENHDKSASGAGGANHRYWDSCRSPAPTAPSTQRRAPRARVPDRRRDDSEDAFVVRHWFFIRKAPSMPSRCGRAPREKGVSHIPQVRCELREVP